MQQFTFSDEEERIRLSEITHRPEARKLIGYAPSIASVDKWASRGVRGIRLPTLWGTCGRLTTLGALRWFLGALNEAAGKSDAPSA